MPVGEVRERLMAAFAAGRRDRVLLKKPSLEIPEIIRNDRDWVHSTQVEPLSNLPIVE